MSDAPRSSDSGKPPELDPPPRHAEQQLGEISTMAAASVDDFGDRPPEGAPREAFEGRQGSSPTPGPPPLPPADRLNGAGNLASASETGHGDAQPLPDASFSGYAPMPALPRQAADAARPEGADAHVSSQPQAEPPIAVEPSTDVSPILSALDAAEKRELPSLVNSASRTESRPQIALPPERRLFGFDNAAPPPIPRDWPPDVDELPPTAATVADSSQEQELSSPSGMMRRQRFEELHRADDTPLPAGPAADALDAAAKIAAEASAAAEALENLKRLLGSRAANVETTTSPVVTAPPPPPIERHEPALEPAPIVPHPVPPPMPLSNRRAVVPADLPAAMPMEFERDRNVGVVLRGFLAGLGLSLAAGAVLYFFMTAG